jgi:Nucleotidyl transferase AbiEii toxin, Type IV TA system
MLPEPFSAVAAREAVHLLILQELAKVHGGDAVVLKGGVNLRLFFGSVRYSEDMDLDGDPEAPGAVRSCIHGIFEDGPFIRRLKAIEILGLDPGEGPNKDTEMTFRFKFGVVMRGGVRHPKKVEVSFRDRYPGDQSVVGVPDSRFFAAYGIEPMSVRSYRREAAVRQKIDALGGRREAQARDLFDLSVLTGHVPDEALRRAYAITFQEYEGTVLEFLDLDVRPRYDTDDAWTGIQLRAAELIEAVLEHQGET